MSAGVPCRLCGSPDTAPLFERPGTYFWHGALDQALVARLPAERLTARLHACRTCGFIGIPIDAELRQALDALYHSSSAMPGTTHGAGNLIAEARTGEFFAALEALGLTRLPERVLEVGCQNGFLLKELLNRGARRAVGVEPSAAEPVEGPEVRRGYLTADIVAGESFDLVYALQVFEHVEDPLAFLRVVRSVMTPDGALVLAVPNEHYALAVGYAGAFIFQHVNMFTPVSLTAALAAAGFVVKAMLSAPDMPLHVLATPAAPVVLPRDPRGVALLDGFERALQDRLERLDRAVAGKPGESVALWGVNVAMCNAFSWLPGLAGRGLRVFDSDPRKIGKVFGGVPGRIEGPGDLAGIREIHVLPYNMQDHIVHHLQHRLNVRVPIRRLYAD